ncbi:sensor domain-containing diguanylate cyclase [Pseudomonas huanghezhanensis]|uniref:sensor domain-containing diguanylate cyclase n=1 Tax=Pseudomonas huanghezhanensis TaxID=3002903 RepID=UPI00228659F3|nr:diguanylate cyclase [Pseudomonas sp. BSw22131]
MSLNPSRTKVLGFISEEASSWVVAILAFAAGIVLTALLAMANVEFYNRQMQQRFELLANERFSRIQERLDGQVQRLDSLRRFFVFSDEVSEDDFIGFANSILIWTEAYSWLPRVVDADRAQFEAKARREGATGFSVRTLDPSGVLETSPRRDVYYPARYMHTLKAAPNALGFDVNSEPLRHAVLERARVSGLPAASPRMQLFGLDPQFSNGVLLVAAVVSRTPNGVINPALIEGYVSAVINLRKLMTEGLPAQDQDNLSLTLTDTTVPQAPDLLYQSGSSAAISSLYSTKLLTLADRRYLLEVKPTAKFLSGNPSTTDSVVIVGGLLSFLLSTLFYVLISQRQRALRLVDQSTAQLRQREVQLRDAHGQLCNVLDAATQVAIIATDLDGVIATFNVGAQLMLGYTSDAACGHLTLQALHLPAELDTHTQELSQRYGHSVASCDAMLVEAVDKNGKAARDCTFVRQDGSTLLVNMQVSAVLDEHGQWVGYLAVCLDVTERKRVEEELRTMSVTDPLTGVYNRRYFEERLEAELVRVGRHGGELSVIMLDLDHFKAINDDHGHAMGDRVLQMICQRMGDRLRRTDVFCRFGGEEFMILCPDTDSSQAYRLARELWGELRGTPVDDVGRVTASFGMATWRWGETGETLLLRADSGVYAAKQAGRDRIQPEMP